MRRLSTTARTVVVVVAAVAAGVLLTAVPAAAQTPTPRSFDGTVEVLSPSPAGPAGGQYGTAYAGYDTLDVAAAVTRPSSAGNLDGCSPFSAADGAVVAGKLVWLEWDDNTATRRCDAAVRANNAAAAGAAGVLLTSTLSGCRPAVDGNASTPLFQLDGAGTARLRPALAAGTLKVRLAGSLRATTAATPCADSVTIASGDGQSTPAGSAFSPLVVAVRDASRDLPVPGAPVTFTVAEGSATFPGGSPTATVTTGADGLATAPTLTAGATPGPVVVGAGSPAVPDREVAFQLTVTAAPAGPVRADLSASLSAPAAAPAGTPFPVTLTVRNAGPSAATTVGSGITLPSGLRVTDAGGGAVTPNGRSVGFAARSLAPGAALTYTVRVTADRGSRGDRRIAAATGAAVRDPALGDNVTTRTVRIG